MTLLAWIAIALAAWLLSGLVTALVFLALCSFATQKEFPPLMQDVGMNPQSSAARVARAEKGALRFL